MFVNRYLLSSLFLLLSLTGCKQSNSSFKTDEAKKKEESLAVRLKNITSRPLYATCFCYLKKQNSPRWHWYKTPVYEATPNTEMVIPIARIPDQRTRENVYGVLGVFTTPEEAEKAIYELLNDAYKIDLDRLVKLQNETVMIGVEKYGIQGDIFDYDFIPNTPNSAKEVPELDFWVENQTGRPIFATAFIYQKKEDQPIWKYDKSPIVRIEPNEQKLIDVDTITDPYNRKYTRGHLAIFEEAEEQDAEQATYQLLKSHQKVSLGLLSALQTKKVVLKFQRYGILGDSLKFTVEDTH